jgi:hypothetical protein
MTNSRWERIAPLSGLVGVAAIAAAAILTIQGIPGDNAPGPEIVSYYQDSGNQGKLEGAAMLFGVGGFFLLVFVGALRRSLGGGGEGLAAAASGAGLVFTALVLAFGAVRGGVPTALDWFERPTIDPDTAKAIDGIAVWLNMYAGMAGGVLVGASSILARRTHALPRWLALAGFPVAGAGFLTILLYGAPVLLELAWIVAVSVSLARRGSPAPARERAVSAAPVTS